MRSAAANIVPSGEKATLKKSLYPLKVRTRSLLSTSHRRIGSSKLPETSSIPSGEKATLLTLSVCPSKVRSKVPLPTETGASSYQHFLSQHCNSLPKTLNVYTAGMSFQKAELSRLSTSHRLTEYPEQSEAIMQFIWRKSYAFNNPNIRFQIVDLLRICNIP